jgi:membrane protease YdiL (CAAX protease family)
MVRVIPVDAPFSPWMLGAVLVALLTVLVWRAVTKDRREYQRFKRYRSTQRRQKMFRKWLFESMGWFGGSALVVLVLVWGFVPRMLAQVETWPAMVGFRSLLASSDLATGLIVGGAIGLFIGVIALVFFGRSAKEVPTIGDIHALLPRNRAELKFGWALSINAGVVEELLFRLAMPALIFAVVGDALVAISVSLVVFGALHAYQGVGGVIGSFVIGVVLMAVFLATGTILWPILVHAVFDLRSLVLIPVVVYQVHLPEGERRVKAEDVEDPVSSLPE